MESGRDIHVGDTIIGIQVRVGFEAAAPLDYYQRASAWEAYTYQWQLFLEKSTIQNSTEITLHEGPLPDPVNANTEAFLSRYPRTFVNGEFLLCFSPNRFTLLGDSIEQWLMSNKFGKLGENGIQGLQLLPMSKGFYSNPWQSTSIFHKVNIPIAN